MSKHYTNQFPKYSSQIGAVDNKPFLARCANEYVYKRVAPRYRVRAKYVRLKVPVQSLNQCQQECNIAKEFPCRSFNYLDSLVSFESRNANEREIMNCELSDRDSRELDLKNPDMFDEGNYDFYERNYLRSTSESDVECLDGMCFCLLYLC